LTPAKHRHYDPASPNNETVGQRILVAKGAIAPRAAYEPIAGRFIEVDTPGATAVNPARFTYQRARRPLFGLDQMEK